METRVILEEIGAPYELTESLFPPQANGELSDITVGELLNSPHLLPCWIHYLKWARSRYMLRACKLTIERKQRIDRDSCN